MKHQIKTQLYIPAITWILSISLMKHFTQSLVRKIVNYNDLYKNFLQFRIFWLAVFVLSY